MYLDVLFELAVTRGGMIAWGMDKRLLLEFSTRFEGRFLGLDRR